MITEVIFPGSVFAARPPNIVEKAFVVKGEGAKQAATLLGLPTDKSTKLTLPWNRQANARNCSWGQAKPDPTFKRCEDLPVPTNIIMFTPGAEPELRLGGHWNDESTGSGAGYARFSVGMPIPIPKDSERGDWELIDQSFKGQIATATKGERGELIITTPDSSSPRFMLTRYRGEGSGALYLTIDFDSPSERSSKKTNHEDCLKENGHLDGGC